MKVLRKKNYAETGIIKNVMVNIGRNTCSQPSCLLPVFGKINVKVKLASQPWERYSTVPFPQGGGIFFMKNEETKHFRAINKKSLRWIFASRREKTRILIRDYNPEEKERFWQKLSEKMKEENL
ncbi:MAG: hypothetical protein K2N84_00875 [Clostridia bacterium]|nr:hypothetical protein [Clostridia bacterium]